jgi:hypothetical protein
MMRRMGEQGAAYCARSETIFTYEARDLFSGELFCPQCATRTDPKDRAPSISELLRKHPKAKVHRILKP